MQGEKYDLSFWARGGDGFSGPLNAMLESLDGVTSSSAEKIKGVTGEWRQFKATLTASRSEPKARFVLTAGAKGKVWFDMVSLLPAQTFKQHGLRPDLAQ